MKKFIKILLFLICFVMVFSGCVKKEAPPETLKPQITAAENEIATEKEEVITETKKALPETPKEEKQEEKAEPPITLPEEDNSLYCTLSVKCDEVLSNMDMLKENKKEIIPPNGIIYPEQKIKFSEGESAFDILKRELTEKSIHLEFVKTPGYDSMYIEGIGNLYEFDCGEYSGWLYKINGEKMTYGCSKYLLKNGDKVEFLYTCNFLKAK